jgi:hypothetical protein
MNITNSLLNELSTYHRPKSQGSSTRLTASGNPGYKARSSGGCENMHHHHALCSSCPPFPWLLNYSSCKERRRFTSPVGKSAEYAGKHTHKLHDEETLGYRVSRPSF